MRAIASRVHRLVRGCAMVAWWARHVRVTVTISDPCKAWRLAKMRENLLRSQVDAPKEVHQEVVKRPWDFI